MAMMLFRFEWRRFLQAAAAIVVTNCAFWVLGNWLALERAAFNLDLVLALIVMAGLPRIGLVLVVIAWLCDWLVAQSLIFHFADSWEFVRSARFVTTIDVWSYLTSGAFLLLLPFALCFGELFRTVLHRRHDWPYVALFGICLVVADVLNGSSAMSGRDVRIVAANVTGSPAMSIAGRLSSTTTAYPLRPLPEDESITGLAHVKDWAQANTGRSVVLVLVESMGKHRSANVRNWQTAQLVTPEVRARYELEALDVPFRGATTSAELRALCGLHGVYRHMNVQTGLSCLPSSLAALGWRTMGIHGFSGAMFDRDLWWSLVGLQHNSFAETLKQQGLPSCGGAFRGICDSNLVHLAFQEAVSVRSFVYLLTLNTHLPLAAVSISDSERQVCSAERLDEDVCQMVAQTGRVLSAIGKEAAAVVRAPLIVVIGDHAPPFARTESREQFDQKYVPAYILRPQN